MVGQPIRSETLPVTFPESYPSHPGVFNKSIQLFAPVVVSFRFVFIFYYYFYFFYTHSSCTHIILQRYLYIYNIIMIIMDCIIYLYIYIHIFRQSKVSIQYCFETCEFHCFLYVIAERSQALPLDGWRQRWYFIRESQTHK